MSEGLAHYGSWVGAPHDFELLLETIPDTLSSGTPTGTPKPQVEAHVAVLFNDLIDAPTGGPNGSGDVEEPEDKTHYHPHYVMKVFATCEVKHPQILGDWRKRNDVADFVWCLENRVDTSEHTDVFPDIETPHDAQEEATEPSDWNADSIRSTWLWNMQ